MSRTTTPVRLGAVAVLAAALALGGCTKQGRDTTCKDFQGMSDSDQRAQVAKLYKDKHGQDASSLVLTGLQQQAVVYCQTAGKPDSKIKEIPIS